MWKVMSDSLDIYFIHGDIQYSTEFFFANPIEWDTDTTLS